jgi:Helix-turn-helix domain
MNHSSPSNSTASSPLAGKINRKQVAAYCGLCVRTIDELTRTGVLGHFRIGKSIRYDLAEVEATLRERFHVGGAGRAGCPQPAASKPKAAEKRKNPQDNLPPTIHGIHSAAATADKPSHSEHQEPHNDGGLRTSRPTSNTPPFDIPHSGFVIPTSATTQPSA